MENQPKQVQEYPTDNDLDDEICAIIANNSRNTKLYDIPPAPEDEIRPGSFIISPSKALAIIRHIKITFDCYNKIFKTFKIKTYPDHKEVDAARRCCYPQNVKITEDKFYVPLEDICAHSTIRVLQAHQEVILKKLKELCPNSDSVYAEISMEIHIKQEPNSVMAIYVSPMKLEYKGNSIEGTDISDDVKDELLWKTDTPKCIQSGRPHLLEFAECSRDYVVETKKDVDKEVQKLSQEIHCFKFEDGFMIRVSYSFQYSDTFDNFLKDDAVFENPACGINKSKIYLDYLSRERLEYTDPVILESRIDVRLQKHESLLNKLRSLDVENK